MPEEDAAFLKVELERAQRKIATMEAADRESERFREERPMGTSSADRGGTAAPWSRGVSFGGDMGRGLSFVHRGTVPKFPMECPPYVYIAWERRFELFIANQGLNHTISPDAPRIAVISCPDDAYLFEHFGEALVVEHRRTWAYICEATTGAPFENRIFECNSVADTLRTMRE